MTALQTRIKKDSVFSLNIESFLFSVKHIIKQVTVQQPFLVSYLQNNIYPAIINPRNSIIRKNKVSGIIHAITIPIAAQKNANPITRFILFHLSYPLLIYAYAVLSVFILHHPTFLQRLLLLQCLLFLL